MISRKKLLQLFLASGCLGAFCKWLPDEDLSNVMDDVLFNTSGSDDNWQIKHGRSAGICKKI